MSRTAPNSNWGRLTVEKEQQLRMNDVKVFSESYCSRASELVDFDS